MRIVNIARQMSAGGTESASILMSAALRKRGHVAETWFLYLSRPTYLGQEGVRVLSHRPPKGKTGYLGVLIALIQELRSFRPDAVVTYGPYANIHGQIGAFLAGMPVRVASQRNPSWIHPRFIRYLDWLMGSLGIYTANIAVSRSVYDSFHGYPKPYLKRLRVIYNGLVFNPSSLEPAEAREKFALPKQVPLMINVGRLVQQKNQALLLQALSLVPETHLAIAGEGKLRQPLVEMATALGIQNRVHLLGEIPPGDVSDFLKAGDLFLFPSLWEGFGFALLEAMCAGIPVIASDLPVVREVLGNDEAETAGLLVPPDDSQAWSEAIQRLLQDSPLRISLSLRAQRRATLFDLARMVDGYEDCFH